MGTTRSANQASEPQQTTGDQTSQRVALGFQCPECFGVQIENRFHRFYGFEGWQCRECGCQWSPTMLKAKVTA